MKQTRYAFAIAALAVQLHAQESTTVESKNLPQLEAVTVVTGDLWESELQRSTASVTVIDSAALEINGTQHFADIIDTIPNLTWTGGTSRPRYIQIRGIGENSQFEGETPDSSVRFLIDDLDLTGLGTVGNLFDVQQVELLRGPQAGAFGANAAGGVVRIVTNDPTPYWSGQIEGTVGTDSLYAGGIAVGGPILKNDPQALTFRLSVHQLAQDGFRDNHFLNKDDTNERDELTSRLKLRWIANDDWQWDGTLFYANADNGYDEFSLDNTKFDTYSDQPGRDEQETLGASLRGTWTGLDAAKLTTITSYTGTDSLYSYDADWTDAADPRSYDGFLKTERDRRVFSQEIRIDSKDQTDALGWIDRWTFGAYFQILNEDTDLSYEDMYAPATVQSEYETETYAIFGQTAHDFSERTRLIIGLRGEYHSVDFASNTTDDYFGLLVAGETSESESNFLLGGKITLEHDLNAANMLFGSVARGYKAGGANSGAFREAGQPLTYGNETLWNTEIGLRSEWFDGAVHSQLTAFYLYREDPQLRDSEGTGGFFRYLTVNGDSAEHFGLEGEATWLINEHWNASAGLGLLETERESYTSPGGSVPSRELANAPSFTYNASLNYQADCGFFANAEVVGRDDYYESNSHSEKRDAFAQVNASVGYRYENWTLTVWAKNLFDENYAKRVFYFGNEEPSYEEKRYEAPADPQQFGVTLSYIW